MNGYRLLGLKERDEWSECLRRAGVADFYFTPDYAELCAHNDKGSSCCFIYEECANIYVYPFRTRLINEILPEPVCERMFDVTSDYGYGGPVSNSESEDFLKRADQAFRDFCACNNVIAEFVRFHPVLQNFAGLENVYDLIPLNKTVIVAIDNLELIWKNFRKGHKSDISRSKGNGLTIRMAESDKDWADFKTVYDETMRYLEAGSYYYFSDDYFNHLRSLNSHVKLWLADFAGKIVGAACFFFDKNSLHYHLAGLNREFAREGSNKRLVYEACRWGSANGLKVAHLGGGFGGSDNDNLMAFKAGFSDLRGQFCIAKRILDEVRYQKICEIFKVSSSKKGYFPAYRSPEALRNVLKND